MKVIDKLLNTRQRILDLGGLQAQIDEDIRKAKRRRETADEHVVKAQGDFEDLMCLMRKHGPDYEVS